MRSRLQSDRVGRLGCLAAFLCCTGFVWSVEAEPPRTAPMPPLRDAYKKPAWLGSAGEAAKPTAQTAWANTQSVVAWPIAQAVPVTIDGIVPDAKWCGIEVQREVQSPVPLCKRTTLPCGPVSFEKIHNNSGEETDDLDGDGVRDVVVGGRVTVSSKEVFAAIYRGGENGYVLSDYRVIPPRAEPTFANVLLVENGQPPVLRDGHDVVEPNGKSLSVARLRRFDGQQFRTLLSFCAHRSEPSSVAPGGVRQGLNRVDFVDVDRDGKKEVVIQGVLAPVVFRFANGGLMLLEDRSLTQTFVETSRESNRAKTLRAEAESLLSEGDMRRAADVYQRAFLSTPYDIDLGLAAAEAHIRAGHPERSLDIATRLRMLAPERASVFCMLATVYKTMERRADEQAALKHCAERETDEFRRKQAQNRLREMSGQAAPQQPAPAPKQPTNEVQNVLGDGLGVK
ncbi:MAG TPA: hypothetical protein PKE31_10365 [Pseudomonadota bacterium]|nr:hypothetical protein [Pseudomonadota bacterium]